MKTAVLLALLGYTNAAAAPSALPPASTSSRAWKWTDASAPATTDLDGKHVKAEWSNATVGTTSAGPLKGYMTGIVACLTQNISAGVAAATAKTPSQSVADVGTTKAFTFWPADAANIGTYVAKPTYVNTDADGTKLASGSLWKVMNTADAADLVGGLGCLLTATDEYKATTAFIANRVWAKVDQSGDQFVSGTLSSTKMSFHPELLVASMYQSTGAKTDGSNWCSAASVSMKAADKASDLIANAGWGAGAKCTFKISGADGTVAPGFKLTTADSDKFYLYFAEWLKADGLPSTAWLNTASGAAFHLGAYAADTLNPAKSVTDNTDTKWKGTADFKWAAYSVDPSEFGVGSIGTASYYAASAGYNGDTQILSVDSSVLLQNRAAAVKANDDYNTQVNTYNGLKDTYNKAIATEKARLADVFKATFDPKTVIPTRPCPPTQPSMFSGPRLSLNRAFDTTAVTYTVIKAKPADYLQTAWIKSDTNSAGSAGSSRLAFLQSADTATLTTTGQVGHVFGKLGQGTAAMPETTNKGFAWAKSEATNTPTILVNLIPSVAAATLADKKTITVNAAPLGWHAATDFDLPAVPGKAADPDNLGAKALAATLVAAAAVGSTLF